MRDKLYRFMQGRNGMDELARMQSWLVLILLLVGMFTRIGLFSFVALILMIYMYFRVFSRNTSKRYEENQKYLNFRYNRTVSWNRFKKRMGQARDYRFFKCPMCKQEVRVPRTWKDRDYLPEMQGKIYSQNLNRRQNVRIY